MSGAGAGPTRSAATAPSSLILVPITRRIGVAQSRVWITLGQLFVLAGAPPRLGFAVYVAGSLNSMREVVHPDPGKEPLFWLAYICIPCRIERRFAAHAT